MMMVNEHDPVQHLLLIFKTNFHELEVRQINRRQTYSRLLSRALHGMKCVCGVLLALSQYY
jgi:hypothetical protein